MGLTISGIESDGLKLLKWYSAVRFMSVVSFNVHFVLIGLINSLLLLLFVIVEFHLSKTVERRTVYTVIDKGVRDRSLPAFLITRQHIYTNSYFCKHKLKDWDLVRDLSYLHNIAIK